MAMIRGVRTDGIVSRPITIVTPPSPGGMKAHKAAVRAYYKDYQRGLSFNGRVAELAKWCRAEEKKSPKPASKKDLPSVPEFGSVWYAMEIGLSIKVVRTALAAGDAERAASEAVLIGVLVAEAEARHRWPVVQFGIGRTKDAQRAGRERGKTTAAKARQEDERVRKLIRSYESDPHPALSLVAFLAKRTGYHPETIRRRLKRLGIQPSAYRRK